MGLLDDAIREHLELKRRRGADAEEVARQENEAFGPPRRGELEASAVATAEPGDPEPALDEPAGFAAEEPTVLHVVPEPRETATEEPSAFHEEPAPAEDPPAPAAPVEEPPATRPEIQEEPPRPHGDPADDLPEVEQATRAFDAEEIRAATTPPPVAPQQAEPDPPAAPAEPARAEEDEPVGEDVLEETPEFLQETPEHDRLWFEQRPPRDFDF